MKLLIKLTLFLCIFLFCGMPMWSQSLTITELVHELEAVPVNAYTLSRYKDIAEFQSSTVVSHQELLYRIYNTPVGLTIFKDDLLLPVNTAVSDISRVITVIPNNYSSAIELGIVINLIHTQKGISKSYGVFIAVYKDEKWEHPRILIDGNELKYERAIPQGNVILYNYGIEFTSDINFPTTIVVNGNQYCLVEE